MVRYQHKIIMGISMSRALREQIDQKRGDIPRSKYISRILERQLEHENGVVNNRISLGLYQDKVLLTPHLFHLQHIWEFVLQMDNDNYTSSIYIDKQYYQELSHKEGHINRAKRHEEIIGRRHVNYILSPNGSVDIYVRSSDTPFRLETEGDEITILSFLGQVRDRLLYCITDIRERSITPITEWILKECDLNKDIRIDEKAQLTLPDIQLRTAAGVFRLYIKTLKDRAVCRAEESLKLDCLLPEALDNFRHPYKSIESKLSKILEIVDRNEEHSPDNTLAQSAKSSDAVGGQ